MDDSHIKYKSIASRLEGKIRGGAFLPGNQLPSEQELAREYDASRLTVRRALAELAGLGLVESRQGLGSFVCGAAEQTRRTLRTLHLIDRSEHREGEYDPFQAQLTAALAREAARRGMGLTITLLERHQTVADFLDMHGVPASFDDGVVIHAPFVAADLGAFAQAGVPYALIPAGIPMGEGIPVTGTDDAAGIRLCCEHLVRYGHRRIALLGCQPGQSGFNALLAEYRRMLAEAGIAFDPQLVISATPWEREEGAAALERLLARGAEFTGLISYGDQATLGAVESLRRAGRRIPEDLSVVVFDRYDWLDAACSLRLSGTRQDVAGIAAEAVRILEEQKTAGAVLPQARLVCPEFVTGSSCQYCFTAVAGDSR